MIITSKVNMDLMTPDYPAIINGVQDDRYTRELEITVTSSGTDWAVPKDAAVLVRFSRSDGSGGQYDTLPNGKKAWTADENVLKILLAPQVLAVPGPVNIWITLTREEEQLSTFAVMLNVQSKAGDCTGNSEGYVNVTGFLPGTLGAAPGQFLRITQVREDGYVTALEPVALGDHALLNGTQTLTEEQQDQARRNIGAAAEGDIPATVLRYEAQALTAEQQAQARANIGAAAEDNIPTAVLRYEAQALTAEQQAQARANIGAAAEDNIPTAVLRYEAQALTAEQQTQARANIGVATVEDILAALPTWEGGSY